MHAICKGVSVNFWMICAVCSSLAIAQPLQPLVAEPWQATATPQEARENVALSWRHARAFVPFLRRAMPISRIPRDKSYPVVLFMHGCWGSDTKEHFDWAGLLTAQGYVVVMPDSFARPKHKRTCAFINRHGGARPAVHDMRLAEIEYAKKQIEQQPWFDGRNLFLMGYSEGAIAAVRTPLEGFRGVIAIAWTCTHRSYPPLHGIFLPKSTSLLTLSYEQDSWFPLWEVQGNCGEHMRGRRHAKHVVLPNQGRIHHILHKVDKRIFNIFDTHGHNHGGFNNENARQEVVQFIAQNLRR